MIRFQTKNTGFTMIELITVMVVLGIISVAAISGGSGLVQSWRMGNLRQDKLNEASAALNRMTREIRTIAHRNAVFWATPTYLEFQDVDGNIISYNYAGTTVGRDLNLTLDYKPLAQDVTALTFRYYRQNPDIPDILVEIPDPWELSRAGEGACTDIRMITIQMTLDCDGQPLTLRTGVTPVNLQFE
ncbi:MAG: type II secretion system protein [Pseudomonadota bacterium]